MSDSSYGTVSHSRGRTLGVVFGVLSLALLGLGIHQRSQLETSQPAATHFTPDQTKMRDFQLLDWVRLEHNPTGEIDKSLGETFDADDWRLLTLTAPKEHGGYAEVALARPLWWLEQRGAREGETIHIAVPECGIDGEATVHAIDPCPPIAPNPPPNARLVIGTFKHYGAAVVDLTYEAESPTGERITDTLVTTPNHPFWSEDKQDYIRADTLKPGETLRTLDGFAKVVSIKPRAEPETVYNIEVFGDHLYHVGNAGVLVHNARPCPERIAALRRLDSVPEVSGVYILRLDDEVYVGSAKNLQLRLKDSRHEHVALINNPNTQIELIEVLNKHGVEGEVHQHALKVIEQQELIRLGGKNADGVLNAIEVLTEAKLVRYRLEHGPRPIPLGEF